MNPGTSTQPAVDPDADNRLRHGLNPDCLAHIFQFVDIKDLWTLGGMNEHFTAVINNSLLQKYKVQVIETEDPMDLTELFERHGKSIKRFAFISQYAKIIDILQQIDHHCAVDQFRHTEIEILPEHTLSIVFNQLNQGVDFPIHHFRKVETFWMKGTLPMLTRVNLPHFQSLRALNLYHVKLVEFFDWTALKDVIELDLVQVAGINIDNFIQYIRQEPKLQKFVHMHTFGEMQKIGEEMAEHCHQIHSFSDFDGSLQDYIGWQGRDVIEYNYLASFRNLRELSITSTQKCAFDLLSAIIGLADNNLLTKLSIIVSYTGSEAKRCDPNRNNQITMETFKDLKTIHIHQGKKETISNDPCQPMQLLIDHSTEILSNVETVIITGSDKDAYHFEFIRFVPKLRKLLINNIKHHFDFEFEEILAMQLVTIVRDILDHRKSTENNGNFLDNSIEIIINGDQWDEFQKIENIQNNINFRIVDMDCSELPICDSMYEYRHGKDKVKLPSEEMAERDWQEVMDERNNNPFSEDYGFDDDSVDYDWNDYSSDE